MANLRYTARFKRDYRKGVAKGCDGEKLKALLELLRLDYPLPLGSRDAAAENAEVRSCRVEPGWQLNYRVKEGEVTLLRLKFARKERPKAAPPMALWFKTLLRSPVKTALTMLLLAVAAFLLLKVVHIDSLPQWVLEGIAFSLFGLVFMMRNNTSGSPSARPVTPVPAGPDSFPADDW